MQGDVVAVYNDSGALLVSYIYDAWGNFTETVHSTSTEGTLASELPFRYRSYYYDTEIGLYYLNTRYYDASIGRFINADDTSNLGANGDLEAYNLYAYCSNNPIMLTDPNGEFGLAAIFKVGKVLLSGIVNGISEGIVSNETEGNFWSGFAKGFVIGAVEEIIEPKTIIGKAVYNAVADAVTTAVEDLSYNTGVPYADMKTSKEIGENMLVSGATSFTTSLVSSFVCDKIFQPGVYDGVSISKKESFVAGLFFGVAIDVIGGKISYERTR